MRKGRKHGKIKCTRQHTQAGKYLMDLDSGKNPKKNKPSPFVTRFFPITPLPDY